MIDGMAGTISGVGEAAKAARESEVEKLHAKIRQLVEERDFLLNDFCGCRPWCKKFLIQVCE